MCHFCDHDESIDHLFFTCPIAKVVWAGVAKGIGANNVPTSLQQCWIWYDKWLPKGKKFHMWGVSAICWAIWKAINKICFDGKKFNNPIEIICHACALMRFWTGLYAEVEREMLINGVNTMLKVAAKILAPKSKVEDRQGRLQQGDPQADDDQNL